MPDDVKAVRKYMLDDGLQEVNPMRMKKNIPSKAKYTTKSDQPKSKPERKIKMPRMTKTRIPQDKQNALSIFLRKDPSTMNNDIETNLQIIQDRIKLEDETCYELMFDKDVLQLNPFLKEYYKKSKCKETQHHFQQLNSDYFREHLLKQDPQNEATSNSDLPEPGKTFLNKGIYRC